VSDSLVTYLHDHLAGSNFAIELLEFLRDKHAGDPLSGVFAALLADMDQDRKTLQVIIERAGNGYPVLKEAAAWLGEKMSELKLRLGAFGTFEALEAVALGILGKLALWQALSTIADTDARLRAVDFERLAARAREQHARVEDLRLQAARAAFAPVTK
jgi:hypothetical protein